MARGRYGRQGAGLGKERNAASTGELAKTPDFKALDERLLKILDSKDRIPGIVKHGPWYYNFWRDDKNKRGLWRRTTLDEYRKEKPNWELVLDLDALAEQEKENWVWHGANFLQPKYERCLVSLSRGGADASVVREFDVVAKSLREEWLFSCPKRRAKFPGDAIDSLYVSTDFGPRHARPSRAIRASRRVETRYAAGRRRNRV